MGVSVIFLGLGLRDGGRWIYACVEGVPTDGNGWVEGLGVEILEMNGIIRPCHGIRHVVRPQKI